MVHFLVCCDLIVYKSEHLATLTGGGDGPMNEFLYFFFAAFLIVVAIGIYLEYRRKQPKEISIDELPDIVREET